MMQAPARTGEFSASSNKLLDLPEAAAQLEVAVYNFSDQTGQYKAVENGSTFSTAVTQGGTTILIKALEDSGWFKPIERENLSNLSTERNIIRNTKQEYVKGLNPNEPPLPALLYAGLILEGGIISYDTNIVTGGIGARYFGLGGSARYRQDRITVYLRAVSTSSGEILKTIYVSKTVLSQALDANFFRFVKFQRLLEAETGITQNEPVQIAVKDAIEKAVHDLIVEGVQDQYWGTKAGREANEKLVSEYLEDKKIEESTQLYDRLFLDKEYKNSFSLTGGINLADGDYESRKTGYMAKAEFEVSLNKYFGMGLAGTYFKLDNSPSFEGTFASLDLNGYFDILPNDNFKPYIFAGAGTIFSINTESSRIIDEDDVVLEPQDLFLKVQYGVGLKYQLNPKLSLKSYIEHNVVFSDELDQVINGKRDDFYFNFGLGIQYNFNFKNKNSNNPNTVQDEN